MLSEIPLEDLVNARFGVVVKTNTDGRMACWIAQRLVWSQTETMGVVAEDGGDRGPGQTRAGRWPVSTYTKSEVKVKPGRELPHPGPSYTAP